MMSLGKPTKNKDTGFKISNQNGPISLFTNYFASHTAQNRSKVVMNSMSIDDGDEWGESGRNAAE